MGLATRRAVVDLMVLLRRVFLEDDVVQRAYESITKRIEQQQFEKPVENLDDAFVGDTAIPSEASSEDISRALKRNLLGLALLVADVGIENTAAVSSLKSFVS